MRVGALAVAVAGAAGLAGAASAGADDGVGTEITSLGHSTPIDARGGVVTFSVYDAALRRLRLAVSDGGPVRLLPAPPRRDVFDASVGSDARGQPVVTYSECRRSVRRPDPLTARPYWPDQRGCRVISIDLGSGKRQTLKTQRTKGGALWMPVQVGGVLVYARLRDRGSRTIVRFPRSSYKRYVDHVRRYRFEVVRQDRRGRTRVLTGGPHPDAPVSRQQGEDIEIYGSGVTSLDFDGQRVAYTWANLVERGCPQDELGNDLPYSVSAFVEQAGRRERLGRGCNIGTPGRASSISLLPDQRVSWLRLDLGTSQAAATVILQGTPGGPVTLERSALPPDTRVDALAEDAIASWYVIFDQQRTWLSRKPSTAG